LVLCVKECGSQTKEVTSTQDQQSRATGPVEDFHPERVTVRLYGVLLIENQRPVGA
jgi:hypothetical protein